MNKISALKFPPIPGEKQTRYGELAKNLEQLLKVNLPSVKELGLVIDTETWPWKKQFDKLPRLQALFTFIFSFNGIIQKASVVDKDHICRYDFPLNVEVPLEIISYHYGANPDLCQEMMKKGIEERRKKYTGSPRHAGSKAAVVPPEVDRELLQGGDAIRTPRSIVWHPDQMSFKISSYLYNRLQNTDFTKTSMARVVVSAAGYQCYVKIKNVSNGHVSSATNDIFTELPVNPATEGYQRSSLISTIPNLEKGKAKELTFELSIPTKQTKPNSTEMIEVPIGSTILLREELIYDEMIAEVTPFQSVRVAPAWPPANQVIPDVILFTDTSYDRHDFQIISKFFTTLNLSVAYFDVEHFCTINDSIQYSLPQPPNTNVWKMSDWEAYAGKSAIWWLPLTKDLASLAHHQDFITHIQKSGGFATGEVSLTTNPFQVPQELNNFLTKEMRNVIAYPDNFSIHALKEMNNNFSISADRITGHYSLLQAIVATFLTMKFEKKLQYLFDQQNKSTLNIIVSQEIQLSDYRVEVEVGCCGFGAKKSKIHPCNRSPLTLRDVLLVAIRTEIMMDLGAFVVTNNPNYCFGINSVLSFCEQNRISSYRNNGKQTPKSIAMFCRDLAAAVTTSNVLGPDKFQSAATNRIFSNVQTKLQLLVSTCHSIAFDHQLDYEGFSERISDLDIVNGFSSRVKGVNSPRDPINIGKGMRLHITGKFN